MRNRLEPFCDSVLAGPLQARVATPDFADWRNVDWSDVRLHSKKPRLSPGGFLTSTEIRLDDILYDFSSDRVCIASPCLLDDYLMLW
jgi:hypothetical protein